MSNTRDFVRKDDFFSDFLVNTIYESRTFVGVHTEPSVTKEAKGIDLSGGDWVMM